jgi:tRNA modification GTPase
MIKEHDTVAALSTGKGKSAIAAIRVSGNTAFSTVGKCISQATEFETLPPQQIRLFTFIDQASKKAIDRIMAVKYEKPHSYTGEDMVELFCHGGEIVVEKILLFLVESGASLAKRGEFTRRAFVNGKIDLLQAEAIQGLIESRTEKALESSIQAYMGAYKQKVLTWNQKIKELLRDVEASIEFPEEDDVANKRTNVINQVVETKKEIEGEIKKKKKSQIIENGINIPIVGIPNAGKSSLFNLLLEYDRSIVHWEEGTTRDSISEEMLICGEKLRLIDTAGLRESNNKVEQMGMQKTWEYVNAAPFVIWVTPNDCSLTEHERLLFEGCATGKIIAIVSKVDLSSGTGKRNVCEQRNIPFLETCLNVTSFRDKIENFIGTQVCCHIGSIETSGIIRNKRQEEIAGRMVERCRAIEENRDFGEDIIALYLRKMLDDIGELVGKTTTDQILESIFSEFCIGK